MLRKCASESVPRGRVSVVPLSTPSVSAKCRCPTASAIYPPSLPRAMSPRARSVAHDCGVSLCHVSRCPLHAELRFARSSAPDRSATALRAQCTCQQHAPHAAGSTSLATTRPRRARAPTSPRKAASGAAQLQRCHLCERTAAPLQPRTVAAAHGGSYLHFGQIAPQRCAYAARQKGGDNASFIEELVVRRELADNFCFYNASSAPLAALRPRAVLACFTSAPGPGPFNATSAPGRAAAPVCCAAKRGYPEYSSLRARTLYIDRASGARRVRRYDSLSGAAAWARESLEAHASDKRTFLCAPLGHRS
jgi:hypothetical protein